MAPKISGTEPGQRQLNGPQTTGREYRNVSLPTCTIAEDNDVEVPMRDGVNLMVDVFRPSEPGRYPVLIAALAVSTPDSEPRSTRGFSRSRCK
jgi:predicted acyl esterase